MTDFFERNLTILKERLPYLISQMKEFKREYEKEKPYVYWDVDTKGTDIIAVERKNHLWYLNSRYDADTLINKWCDNHICKHYFEPILVFGMANLGYLKELRTHNTENPIYIYEPDEAIFFELIKKYDMTEVFTNENTYITVGRQGISQIGIWLETGIGYCNFEYIDFCSLPGYSCAYMYEFMLFKREFMESIETLIMKRNTLYIHGRKLVENEFSHIIDSIHQGSTSELIKALKEKNMETPYAAILVSAGPSLDRNIKDLKNAVGKVFIIAVDTAIRPLLQAGIRPDLFITIDPIKDLFLFEQEGISEIPLVLSINVKSGVSKIHKGRHFYIISHGDYIESIMRKHKKKIVSLNSGGSVATDAFSLLRKMGFKTIILVGQDLAYPEKRSHAKAAYDDMINEKEGIYFDVEDIYGGQVLTRIDMNHYRRWFEDRIVEDKTMHVIDATEGGALIHGTQIMTLKEAIQQEKREEFNFKQLIDGISDTFSVQEKEIIEKEIMKFPDEIYETKEKLKEGLSLFENLQNINKQGKYKKEELQETYDKITVFNNWLEKDEIVDLLSSLSAKEEFEIQNKVYEVKDNLYDDLKDIAEHGSAMVKTYIEKIPILLECMKAMEE